MATAGGIGELMLPRARAARAHGTHFYFAYGSNMLARRILARIPDAVPVEAALLPRYVLRFNKRGRDGSSKCNVLRQPHGEVPGVVYRLDGRSLARLDRIEGSGYRRSAVEVAGIASGVRYGACCYVAKRAAIDDDGVAFDWYRDLVVAGCRNHALPAAHVDALLAAPTRVDPNSRRRRQHRALLCGGGREWADRRNPARTKGFDIIARRQ
jgi:hypothetical protein